MEIANGILGNLTLKLFFGVKPARKRRRLKALDYLCHLQLYPSMGYIDNLPNGAQNHFP